MDKPTVTMLFPKRVTLTLDPVLVGKADDQFSQKKMVFEPGVQEVPLVLASHAWLKDNGAVAYHGQPVPLKAVTSPAINDANRPKINPTVPDVNRPAIPAAKPLAPSPVETKPVNVEVVKPTAPATPVSSGQPETKPKGSK